jgi:hypothetical protein
LPAETTNFSSTLPIIILTRPIAGGQDWQDLDRGPGIFTVPAGHEVRVRIKSLRDEDMVGLVRELQPIEALRFLDLSENRNITNMGAVRLRTLTQLTGMNLSSVSVTNLGISYLKDLRHLAYLDLSFCNKINDGALKTLESMRSLMYVSLQGCLNISNGGISRIRRKTLEIYR